MKRILIILLLTIPFLSSAQTQGTNSSLITNLGGYAIDSTLRIPVRDTISWNGKWGNLTIRPQDNAMYWKATGGWWSKVATSAGSGGSILWTDTISTISTKKNLRDTAAALRSALAGKENLASRRTNLSSPSDTTYPTTKAITDYVAGTITPSMFYAYDRTIDSIDVYGSTTKYVKLYRHTLPPLIDSFQDNNTTYTPGWGLLLTGTTFRVDSTKIHSAHYVDSLASTFYYYAFYPLHIDNDGTNKIITHYSSGVTPGTYTKATVDVYGHVTAGAALAPGDIPNISQNQVNGLVDTLAGINFNAAVFTGTTTKTLKLTRGNGSWIQASFNDNDNQTLSLSNADSLSISGGNTIYLPYIRTLPGGAFQSFTGTVSNTFTLSSAPAASSPVYVTMNNAWLDPVDWSRTGATITLSFNTSSTDLITIYYAH